MIAFCLEKYITNRQCLIYNQDLRIDIDGNCKGKTYKHTAGIGFHRLMDIISDICKSKDIIQLCVDLFLRKADHGTVQIHILKPGIFHIKTGSQFQKGRNTSIDLHFPCGRCQHSCDDLKDRGLPGTVHSDDPYTFSFVNIKIHIMKGIMLPVFFLSGQAKRLFQTVRGLVIQLIHF